MPVDACVVCGAPPRKWSYYCDRCKRLATYRTYVNRRRAMAMKAAWCEERDGFVCRYTGVRLDGEMGRPWSLNFDHAVPGDDSAFAVAAWWVNYMKTALAIDEFWKVVGELDACGREGREFDKNIVGFKYWRRHRGAR